MALSVPGHPRLRVLSSDRSFLRQDDSGRRRSSQKVSVTSGTSAAILLSMLAIRSSISCVYRSRLSSSSPVTRMLCEPNCIDNRRTTWVTSGNDITVRWSAAASEEVREARLHAEHERNGGEHKADGD